ncbi:S1 family peptidase [Roseiconus lacunae]|uniref:S1 family peptidase n=1 Tax=Roseiconus lacunae TaxID=2605694 RepID=UPI001E5D17A8|nr:serine protease [Roseiconus lacunae]MCD0462373.1 serine protease [Roseiconus lacunae]
MLHRLRQAIISLWKRKRNFPAVWYLRCDDSSGSDNSGAFQGSCVPIRIRKKNESGTEETLLLTCAHVIRHVNRNGNGETVSLGNPHQQIRAFLPATGYDEARGIAVVPDSRVLPSLDTGVDRKHYFKSDVPYVRSNDWALIRFKGHTFRSKTENVIRNWSTPTKGTDCIIIGYPGGDVSFKGYENGNRNIVTATETPTGQLSEVDETFQIPELEAREGRSGGGVFDTNGRLLGIHRAGLEASGQSFGISMNHIATRINEEGYEFVEGFELFARIRNHAKLIGALAGVFLLGVILYAWSIPSPHQLTLQQDSLQAPSIIGGESYVREHIIRMLGAQQQGDIDIVFSGSTDSSASKASENAYRLNCSIEGAKLDVAAQLVKVSPRSVVSELTVSPNGLVTAPVSIFTSGEELPVNHRIELLIGIKLPDGSSHTEEDVRKSLSLESDQ